MLMKRSLVNVNSYFTVGFLKSFRPVTATIVLSLFLFSCGDKKLSKEEAKRQIDEQLSKSPKPPTVSIPVLYWTNMGENEVCALEEIKNAGYVDYTAFDKTEVHGTMQSL